MGSDAWKPGSDHELLKQSDACKEGNDESLLLASVECFLGDSPARMPQGVPRRCRRQVSPSRAAPHTQCGVLFFPLARARAAKYVLHVQDPCRPRCAPSWLPAPASIPDSWYLRATCIILVDRFPDATGDRLESTPFEIQCFWQVT